MESGFLSRYLVQRFQWYFWESSICQYIMYITSNVRISSTFMQVGGEIQAGHVEFSGLEKPNCLNLIQGKLKPSQYQCGPNKLHDIDIYQWIFYLWNGKYYSLEKGKFVKYIMYLFIYILHFLSRFWSGLVRLGWKQSMIQFKIGKVFLF